jgi:hypothetical protein
MEDTRPEVEKRDVVGESWIFNLASGALIDVLQTVTAGDIVEVALNGRGARCD